MIFPISGPGGCGKTTTISAVKKILEEAGLSVRVRESLTRKDFSEKYDIQELRQNQTLHLQYQMDLLKKTIELDEKLSRECDVLLTDRSVFDGFVYVMKYVYGTTDDFMFNYFRLASGHAKKYKRIFVLEPLDSFERNGIRDHDESIRYEVFEFLKMFDNTEVVPKNSVRFRACLIAGQILRSWTVQD